MTKIVIFDLDDTLYKEIDYLKSAYQEIALKLEEYGIRDAYSQMIEWYDDRKNVFDMINLTYGLDISKQDLLKIYRNHKPNIQLSYGAEELFNVILRNGDKIGLITDGRTVTQRNKIDALSISDYIQSDNIIISEEFGSEKPDLRNYQYFEELYSGFEFMYIADNPKKDFISANKLGWQTIGLLNDGRNIHPQELLVEREYLPHQWVKSLDEIINLL